MLAVETSRMRTIQLEYRRQGLRLGESIEMKVIVDLCVVPMGVGVSVSKYVAECQKVLQEAGLEHQLHAYGTNIEGEWDAVFAAIKRCHERVHAMGAPRITTSIKVGTRTDRDQTMQDKIDSVTDGNL
ncbi:MTH1187 family thiamine-binding protein [Rosistilla oblonga]|uniref:MTH1187 family thiamine-binding protein n=1 Tax=Rosistilla oblonga TaxID=2527990 RepID=UPI003A96B205